MPAYNTKLTPDLKEAFVSLLSELPNITVVSKMLGIHPSNIGRGRQKDSDFDEQCREAIEQGYDLYEEEARRRAVDGVVEPVFYKGMLVVDTEGEPMGIKKYSDKLLEMLLKACKPRKFNPGAKIKIGDGEKVTLTFNIGGEDDAV